MFAVFSLASCLLPALLLGDEAARLNLDKGDHIAFVGNTLADRMQHHGWLETEIFRRFPRHDLVIRNLGFSGDELNLRLRSQDFGGPDDWLAKTQATVVFAFFGYNESFADEEGLDAFKADLTNFIKHTQSQKYDGKSAPRLVLFTPIAYEDLNSKNLPKAEGQNKRLAQYADATVEVAKANSVLCVDLFNASLKLYEESSEPLTINGIHLNEYGDGVLAPVIATQLFGPATDDKSPMEVSDLRAAVLDKNFHWFNRYRTVDGYSIYGGRADLTFTDGQTNRVVMQREMEVLDVMTANRDRVIWSAAQGERVDVDDSNTPEFIPVVTNKPGAGPGGEHLYLGGEEAIGQMTVAANMKVNLYASEEMFSECVNPVQMAWDTNGRLWVAAWPTYPHWKPKEPMNDKLLILEDTNADGVADVCKTFAGDLHNPTGFEFWNGGVIVAMAPDILFLKDTDGDDVADVRERILSGIDSADTHHTANSFVLDGSGALYFQEGTFHHTQVETPYGPPVRCANAGVFRYEPRTQKFEVFVTYGFANPHGHVFDRWGQNILHDGTGAVPYHAALFSSKLDFPHKHPQPPTVYQQRTRPCPATEILSSSHFPPEVQGNMLVGNVIGFQGILQYKIKDDGASFAGEEQEPIVYSSDPNFRPVDIEIGPDGAIYFTDWQNPIIGHMQHNLRDPSRGRTHGRVYRVTYDGRPLLTPPKIDGEPILHLLDLLKSPEDRVRYRARIELSGRDSGEVIEALKAWVEGLDPDAAEHQHNLLEALWLSHSHNWLDQQLLKTLLASDDFRARAAAARVLCYARETVPGAFDIFKKLAADQHPRVRLEAVRAASFFTNPDAFEVVVIASEHPTDQYIEFVKTETMRTIEPFWKGALARGESIPVTTEAGARFLLKNETNERLLAMKRTRAVNLEILFRPGMLDEQRREALQGLASEQGRSELEVLLDAIGAIDEAKDGREESIVFDLVRQLSGRSASELSSVRPALEKLALSARRPMIRQIGFVALINVDRSPEKAWELALSSPAALRDFVASASLVSDATLRASLHPLIEPRLRGLPESLAGQAGQGESAMGRYVRIELPRRGTLTLAEVEVMSDGRNVAPQGKASQKNTSNGGDAGRAIDGNASGEFGAGGQTHTEENTENPWWELDLGEETPIDSVVIYNRTEGYLGNRLDKFTLTVLDEGRGEIFSQKGIPAPREKVQIDLAGGGPAGVVRRAAMMALATMRGKEQETFHTLAGFINENVDRVAAIRALQRIPRTYWTAEEAPSLLAATVAHVEKIPAADRTSPAALDALEFAEALAGLLPPEEAKAARAALRELGVRVVRLGTLPERMAYDKEVIVAAAGKPIEIVFENHDLMPHNFVILSPGALEEVGLLAEATAQHPETQARQYRPDSPKVMLASRLLQPRDVEKLSFTAPAEPGVYPYVCTYPGHWRRMFGALYVVDDLDAYLANSEAYLAAHPLEIRDDLLKDRRPRTEWKFEDLSTALSELDAGQRLGRSYGDGKQIFQVASCVACHKLDGAGIEIGPDLTKLEAKWQTVDILREILDPSERINEKYQTYVFETASGQVITGLIVEETPDAVKVVENPLVKAEPIVLKKSEIETQQKSPTSIMPKGLLDKLTREEIMDLVAYVAARGDQQSKLFQGAGHDHGEGGHSHH
jgi:putative heme-binding domain-containing protein